MTTNKEHNMSPLEIGFLLHCHVSPTPYPSWNAPAVIDAAHRFLSEELIGLAPPVYQLHPPIYTTTERGKALVEMRAN